MAPPQRESARGLLGFVVRARVCSLAGPAKTPSDSAGKVAGACGTQGAGPGAGPGRGWGRARAAELALPLLLGQLLALTGGGGAFYLEVSELEEKCFIQEIPDGTVVIGAPEPCLPRTQSPGLALPAPRVLRGNGDEAPRDQLRPIPPLCCRG